MLLLILCPKSSKQKYNCEWLRIGWCWHWKGNLLQMSSKCTINHLVKSFLSDSMNARDSCKASIISQKWLASFLLLSVFQFIALDVLKNQHSIYMSGWQSLNQLRVDEGVGNRYSSLLLGLQQVTLKYTSRLKVSYPGETIYPRVMSTSSGSRKKWITVWSCHLLAVWFGASFLTSLCLSFLLCEMVITLPTSSHLKLWGLKGILPVKCLSQSLGHGITQLISNITIFLLLLL